MSPFIRANIRPKRIPWVCFGIAFGTWFTSDPAARATMTQSHSDRAPTQIETASN